MLTRARASSQSRRCKPCRMWISCNEPLVLKHQQLWHCKCMFEHELMARFRLVVQHRLRVSAIHSFAAETFQLTCCIESTLYTPQHGDAAKLHASASDTLFWVLNMLVAVQLSCWCQCKILGVLCTASAMYGEQQGLVFVTLIGCSSRYTVCGLDVIALLAGCPF